MKKTLTFKPHAVPPFPAGSFAVPDWEPFGVQFGDYLGSDDHLRSEFLRRCTGPCDKKCAVANTFNNATYELRILKLDVISSNILCR